MQRNILTGDAKVISKQARDINELRITINQLHDRLSRVRFSNKNKNSQIARLKSYLKMYNICDHCGSKGCSCYD